MNRPPLSMIREARGPRNSCLVAERVPGMSLSASPLPAALPQCRLLFLIRRFPLVPAFRLQAQCSQPIGQRRRDRTVSSEAAPALLCPDAAGALVSTSARPARRLGPRSAPAALRGPAVAEVGALFPSCAAPAASPRGATAAVCCSDGTVSVARVLGVCQSAINAPRVLGFTAEV